MLRQVIGSTGEAILVATGPIAGETAAELGEKLEALASTKFTTITLDLTQVPGMSSQGIGKLIVLKRKLADQEKVLRIRGCSAQLLAIFKMIKLDTIMSIEQ